MKKVSVVLICTPLLFSLFLGCAPKREIKTITEKQTISFKTVEEEDPTLATGESKVKQEGREGETVITYRATYENGQLKSKEKTSEKITKKPRDRILVVGTKPKEHFIKFDLDLVGRTITVRGTTNVPEGSVLSISVHRFVDYIDIKLGEKLTDRVVDFANARVSVKNGKFTFSTALSDKNWYEDEVRQNREYGFEFDRMQDNCYVSVTFTPKIEQPKAVYDVLGKNFENLNVSGPQIFKFKTINVDKDFKLAFDRNV